jgi:hypothetical protein
MKKLSQRELIEEGFGSNLIKSIARGAAGMVKGAAKIVSPTAAKLAGSALDKTGAAISGAIASPGLTVKDMFNSPKLRKDYTDLKIISSEKGGDRKSRVVSIDVLHKDSGERKTADIKLYRSDKGGPFGKEEWSLDGRIVFNDGTEVDIDVPDKKTHDVVEGEDFNIDDKVSWKTSRGHTRVGKIIDFKQQDDGRKDAYIIYTDDKGNDREVALSPDKLTKTKDGSPISEKSQKSLLKHLQSMSS